MERYWSSLLAFKARGEELDVGFWTPSMPLFYAWLPVAVPGLLQSPLFIILLS